MEEKAHPLVPTTVADVTPAKVTALAAAPTAGPEAVQPAPPADAIDPREDVKAPVQKPHDLPEIKAKLPAAKKPGNPGGGVGAAVTATVIIVLGLAAMATYAFIKTQN